MGIFLVEIRNVENDFLGIALQLQLLKTISYTTNSE